MSFISFLISTECFPQWEIGIYTLSCVALGVIFTKLLSLGRLEAKKNG